MLFELNLWLTSYIALLLYCIWKNRKEVIAPNKTFVIEKRSAEDDEEEIEREIQRQLEAKKGPPVKSAAVALESVDRKTKGITYSNTLIF